MRVGAEISFESIPSRAKPGRTKSGAARPPYSRLTKALKNPSVATLVILFATLLPACGGGGGSPNSGTLAATLSNLVGEWLLLRSTNDSGGGVAESDALPTQIRLNGDILELVIGDEGETLTLQGALQSSGGESSLVVSGTDELGAAGTDDYFKLEVLDATWVVSSDLNTLTGRMRVLPTEGQDAPVVVLDEVVMHRADGLADSALNGDWFWALELNDCDDQSATTLAVEFTRITESGYSVLLEELDGTNISLLFRGELQDGALTLSGTGSIDGEQVEVRESNLSYQADRITGTLDLLRETSACTIRIAVEGFPFDQVPTDIFLPFIADRYGSPRLMFVDPRQVLAVTKRGWMDANGGERPDLHVTTATPHHVLINHSSGFVQMELEVERHVGGGRVDREWALDSTTSTSPLRSSDPDTDPPQRRIGPAQNARGGPAPQENKLEPDGAPLARVLVGCC